MSRLDFGHVVALFLREAFAELLWYVLLLVQRDAHALLLGDRGTVLLRDGLGDTLALGLGNLGKEEIRKSRYVVLYRTKLCTETYRVALFLREFLEEL